MDLVHTPNVEKDFASAAVSGKNQEAKSFSRKKKWTRHVCLRVVEKDFASAAVSVENQEAKSFSRKKEMDETCLFTSCRKRFR